MNDKFDEFVKQQIEASGTHSGELDLKKEKALWLHKLEQLYSFVADSISEYIESGSMRLDFADITLTEELLGTYTVREARITIGRQLVKLEPLGTFLIGARGRVDMKGSRGTARFLVVPPDARSPQIHVRVSVVGETQPPYPLAEAPAPPETWVWKIGTPPPRVTYIDLTKQSFREALIGVVNG